jgi:catechol 2,3-dioxygenase-like lactoylglutathione lyase family enzyme
MGPNARKHQKNADGYKPTLIPAALKLVSDVKEQQPGQVEEATPALDKKTDNADVCGYCSLRIPVSDLKHSVEFYCKLLGFELEHENPSEAHIILKNGGAPTVLLMATNPEDLVPLKFAFPHAFWATTESRHLPVLEFRTNDLTALHERMRQGGAQIEKEPTWKADFGYFSFYDPDGHYIQVVEERGAYFSLKQKMGSALGRQLTEQEDQLLWGLCEKSSTEQQNFINSIISELRGDRL